MKRIFSLLFFSVLALSVGAVVNINFNDLQSIGLTGSDFITVPNGDSENTYYEITSGESTTGVIGDSNVKITVAQNQSKSTAKIWKLTSGTYEFRAYKGHTITISLKNGKNIVKITGNGGTQLNYSGDPKSEVEITLTETAKIKSLEIAAEGEYDGPGEDPEIEHITIADFIANADTETTYELTGTVQNIRNVLYGNFDLVENGVSIYVYGLLDANGNAKNFENLGIVEGTKITVTAVYYEYTNADGTVTPEIKNAQFVRIEGHDVGPADPDHPQIITVTEALNIINGLADGATTDEDYVLEGIITTIKDITTQYGNATFMLSDGAHEINVFRCKDLDNQRFTDVNAIKVGDKVKVQGKLQKYVKNGVVDPEVVNCYLLSINESEDYNYDFEVDGRFYKIIDNSHAEFLWMYYTASQNIVIPSSVIYNGKEYIISSIGDYAFRNNTNVKSVLVPNTVTKISPYAFSGCLQLDTIIYTSTTSPSNWTATTNTYVPDVSNYVNPSSIIAPYTLKPILSWSTYNFVYDGLIRTTPDYNSNIPGFTATATPANLEKEVGEYTVNISAVIAKDGKSNEVIIPYHYKITPAQLTVKANDASMIYGDELPAFGYSCSGFVNGENENVLTSNPGLSVNATKYDNVGQYNITPSGASAKNYTFVYQKGVLTINKAPLTVTVDNKTRLYGEANPQFTAKYSGFKNSESESSISAKPTISTEANAGSGVGVYNITASGGSAQNYYFNTYVSGTLTINKAMLAITARNASRLYYESNPTFSYNISGFKNNENEDDALSQHPVLSSDATLTSDCGNYIITVEGAIAPNYEFTYTPGTLTINKRTLKASTGNYTRKYNEENPVFEVEYDGFVNNENADALIWGAQATCSATRTSDAGVYSIIISGGEATNYYFTYANGSLTIEKAEQEIIWDQELNDLLIGDQVELTATTSSGLPISYTLTNASLGTVYPVGADKWYFDCTTEGEGYIRAIQDGNKNYYPAARVAKFVSVVTDGIESVSDCLLKVTATRNKIVVDNKPTDACVMIYNLGGNLVYSTQDNIIAVPSGIYIVKIGTNRVKVNVY